MKKIAIVDVKGGLGNQLFILNFIKYLENQNFKVYALCSFYSTSQKNSLKTSKRYLYLNFESLHIKEAKKFLIIFSNIIKKFHNKQNNLLEKLIKVLLNLLVNFIHDENFPIKKHSKKIINLFDGYWQDYSLLQENFSFLNELKKIPEFENICKENKIIGSTALHIRRKDYLNIKEELSINYYRDALDFCSKNIKNFHYTIFTDDVDWVKKNELFNEASNIFEAKDSRTINDFILFSSYSNFIIANSTYSYMAAFLFSDEKSIVTTPNPWFKNLKYIDYDKIINPNWYMINNE